MNDDIVRIFQSLKVLAAVRENDRVLTRTGIRLDKSDTRLQAMWRWVGSENRQVNLDAIENLFDLVFLKANELVEERIDQCNNLPVRFLENTQHLERLQREVAEALKGVLNLKVTYNADAYTVARIQVLAERVEDRMTQLDLAIQNLLHNSTNIPIIISPQRNSLNLPQSI